MLGFLREKKLPKFHPSCLDFPDDPRKKTFVGLRIDGYISLNPSAQDHHNHLHLYPQHHNLYPHQCNHLHLYPHHHNHHNLYPHQCNLCGSLLERDLTWLERGDRHAGTLATTGFYCNQPFNVVSNHLKNKFVSLSTGTSRILSMFKTLSGFENHFHQRQGYRRSSSREKTS